MVSYTLSDAEGFLNMIHNQKRTNTPFKYYLFPKICAKYLNSILHIYFAILGMLHSIHQNHFF